MSIKADPIDTELEKRLAELKPGDHLCCLYENPEDHRALLTPFIRQGLQQNQKVFYIVDERESEDILNYLQDDGQEVESYLNSGQLQTLSANDAYTRGDAFDPDAMISLFEK
jgi:hypothetical protein